jgi:hypothetical protein
MAADALHKMLSPGTYPCSLCAISYGPLTMHRAWRDTLATLPVTAEFFHSDDFLAAYPDLHVALPAILLAAGAALPQVLIGSSELNQLTSLQALIDLLHYRMSNRSITPSPE